MSSSTQDTPQPSSTNQTTQETPTQSSNEPQTQMNEPSVETPRKKSARSAIGDN